MCPLKVYPRKAVGGLKNEYGRRAVDNIENAINLPIPFQGAISESQGATGQLHSGSREIRLLLNDEIITKGAVENPYLLDTSKSAGTGAVHPAITSPLADVLREA